MQAIMEAPVMTLKEAEEAVREWHDKLDQARATLAETEQNKGTIALAEGPEATVTKLLRLRVEVEMAEAGLAAVTAQRDELQRLDQLERVKQLRAEADELDKQAEEHAVFYNKWAPQVEAAHQAMSGKATFASMKRTQAAELERKFGKVPA